MSLFDSASLCVTPNAYKEDKLYSIKPTDGSGDLVVTRATTATRVNSAGLIESVPYNLINYSNTFTSGDWNPSEATVTGGQTGFDGTSNAYKLQATGTQCYLYQGSFNFNRLQSVYAKAGNYTQLSFIVGGYGNGVQFNLSTGTVANNTNTSFFTPTIESVGNGWYHCSVAVSAASFPSYGFLIAPDFVGGSNSVSGDYIYIQNAQLVKNYSAKEYFPTTDRLNVPRIDYTNGSCPSILVEPQRTNIATYSELFDNGNWNKNNVALTANNTTSPDGTTTADLISADTNNQEHNVYSNVFVITPNVDYTFSYFVKKGTGRYIAVAIYYVGITTGFGAYATYDLNTNTLVASGAPNGTFTGTKIETFANGWVKISVTGKGNAVGAIVDIDIRNASNLIPGVFFTGANETFNIWGAQLELGSYATSYIPTVASAVTRNADVISKTGISSLIGQTEGTVFVDIDFNGTGYSSTNDFFVYVGDGANTDAIYIDYFNNTFRWVVFNGSTLAFYTDIATTNGRKKLALGYKSGQYVAYLNGNLVLADTNATAPPTSANFSIAQNVSGFGNMTKNIKSAALWKTRLTNTELATLTTI